MDIPDEMELFTFTGIVGWFGQAQLLAILASDIEIQDVGTHGFATPLVFGLEQNYPNPFTGSATIGFSLAEPVDVTVSVYDLTGRRVAILVEGELQAGSHTTT